MQLTQKQNPHYRKDIDGLRAIAVLLVVFFHLKLGIANAGFVGVDIFFVISGFLITGHIFEAIQGQRFSLKLFYLKRLRRICPALITVLFFSSIAAYFLLLHSDLLNYVKSQIAALASFSNFYFWHIIHIGYFSTDASKLPLLHTWSLGVEEQYYIVFPLLMLLLCRLLKQRSIFLILLALAIGSFTFYYCDRANTQLVYYSPFTRAFEILTGSCLAISTVKIRLNQAVAHILSIVALLLIIYTGCVLTPEDYPSFITLIPVLSAACLIHTGTYNALGNRILKFKPFVFIGLISYSLYLWHWPIIAYCNYVGIKLTLAISIAIIVASIILATITWQCIEKPFRFKFKFSFKYTFLFIWLLPIICAAAFSLSARYIPNFNFNTIDKQAKADISNGYYGFINPKSDCHNPAAQPTHLGNINACSIGDRQKQKLSVLITGDSHAMANIGMLNLFLKQAKIRGYIASQSSTPFLLTKLPHDVRVSKFINQRNPVIKKLITSHHFKYVVLGGSWADPGYPFNKHPELLEKGLKNSVKFIEAHHAIPVILMDFPALYNIPVNCGTTRVNAVQCYNSLALVKGHQATTTAVILAIKKAFPNIILIDPKKIICQDNKCYSILNGVPLYFTGKLDSHLNFAGSQLIGKQYLQRLGNPFVKTNEQ